MANILYVKPKKVIIVISDRTVIVVISDGRDCGYK